VVAAAVSRRLYDLPIEEFATALLRTPSGVTATIEAGYTHPRAREGGDAEWRVMGRGGYLIEHDGALVVATPETTTRLAAPTGADHSPRFARDTLERHDRGEPAIANIGDCWRAARLIDDIYARAAEPPPAP
jgi:predicted dehydrogenase